jgi:hypothetical protein
MSSETPRSPLDLASKCARDFDPDIDVVPLDIAENLLEKLDGKCEMMRKSLKQQGRDLAAARRDAQALREALQTYLTYDLYINGDDPKTQGVDAYTRITAARAALAADDAQRSK